MAASGRPVACCYFFNAVVTAVLEESSASEVIVAMAEVGRETERAGKTDDLAPGYRQ